MIKQQFVLPFLLVLVVIMGGCSAKLPDATNSIQITTADEETILDYLETKTGDFMAARGAGKLYAAFKLLGTDPDRIYVFALIEGCTVVENIVSVISSSGEPCVLYVKTSDGKIEITGHKFAGDGVQYGKDIARLFPENVRKNFCAAADLENAVKNRVLSKK